MRLFYNPPSPYGRKVLVVVHEKGLAKQIDLVPIDPWKDPPELHAVNPVGKVPALYTSAGMLITESSTISEFLDEIGDGPSLLGDRPFETKARAAVAHGLIDAAFGLVIERRRPVERQWAAWIDRQVRAIERTLTWVEAPAGRFDLGDITLACALGYLDFRLPDIDWRKNHPSLGAWMNRTDARRSMQETLPVAPVQA